MNEVATYHIITHCQLAQWNGTDFSQPLRLFLKDGSPDNRKFDTARMLLFHIVVETPVNC